MDDQHFDNKSITLKVLGCRGSMAVSGKQFTPGGGIELSAILGKEKTISRVKDAISKLSR